MKELWNDETRYGTVAVLLHWLIAAGIVFMVVLGWYMADLPLTAPNKFDLYQLHKSVGITILLLSVLRVLWRLLNLPPPLPEHMKPWERWAARGTHIAFYVLMLAIPLSGWAMVSVSPFNIPTVLFGVIDWPHLPWIGSLGEPAQMEKTFKQTHEVLVWLTLLILALHVVGALKHHFFDRDDVLVRMLPRVFSSRNRAGARSS